MMILSSKTLLVLLGLVHLSLSDQVHREFEHVSLNVTLATKKKDKLHLPERFECFAPFNNEAQYTITICADVPDNNDPARVYVRQEPGHVFLILEKTDYNQSITQVFGFYPRRPASCIMFKNVRCEIMDNGKREYNASLSKKIAAHEFQLILEKAEELAKLKYNLNRFNCYDYVLGVFNSLPEIEKLPITHIKFPFLFGKGGSPCGLYRDLQKLKTNGSVWAPHIKLGTFKAPVSSCKK